MTQKSTKYFRSYSDQYSFPVDQIILLNTREYIFHFIIKVYSCGIYPCVILFEGTLLQANQSIFLAAKLTRNGFLALFFLSTVYMTNTPNS